MAGRSEGVLPGSPSEVGSQRRCAQHLPVRPSADGPGLTQGGCLCGAVRVVATGEPDRVGICHCLDCRKHHGALFYAAAIFPRERVEISGETTDFRGRNFCPGLRLVALLRLRATRSRASGIVSTSRIASCRTTRHGQ